MEAILFHYYVFEIVLKHKIQFEWRTMLIYWEISVGEYSGGELKLFQKIFFLVVYVAGSWGWIDFCGAFNGCNSLLDT